MMDLGKESLENWVFLMLFFQVSVSFQILMDHSCYNLGMVWNIIQIYQERLKLRISPQIHRNSKFQIYKISKEKSESRPSASNLIKSKNIRVLISKRFRGKYVVVVNIKGKVYVFKRLSKDSSTSAQIDKNA